MRASKCEQCQASRGQGEAVARLRRAILEDYSYRDRLEVGWAERFCRFSPRLRRAKSAREFAEQAANLLSAAQDLHLWLEVGGQHLPTYVREVERNVAPMRLPRFVPHWRQLNAVAASGRFADGTLYLWLRSWPPADEPRQALRPAYAVLRRASQAGGSLVIDVRANGGGAEPTAAQFAGCFVDQPVCYSKHWRRQMGKFMGPVKRWLKPNEAGPRYRGRVVVLIGPGTVSSCESFALMMRQVAGCQLVGGRTAGASGNPRPVDLGNGVTIYVPSWQDLLPNGACLEGRGVRPDIMVKADRRSFLTGDPVLEAGLEFLRQPQPRLQSPPVTMVRARHVDPGIGGGRDRRFGFDSGPGSGGHISRRR